MRHTYYTLTRDDCRAIIDDFLDEFGQRLSSGYWEVYRPDEDEELDSWLSMVLDNGRPVSTYEIARRGKLAVRCGRDTHVYLYNEEWLEKVWLNYARAGYTAAQAAEVLLDEAEKQKQYAEDEGKEV